jgi:hypothetical protein
MKIAVASFALLLCLSGCAVYTPSGSVVVDPARAARPGGGKFCPPGQAKKGNC